MGTQRCMNAACGAPEPGGYGGGGGGGGEWKKGWALRSGGFANLCNNCGMAYEQMFYCDVFHMKESGWRECNFCGKRVHCGCIASKSSIELLDGGGVQCFSCMKNSELSLISSEVLRETFLQTNQRAVTLSARSAKDGKISDLGTGSCSIRLDDTLDKDTCNKAQAKAVQLGKQIEGYGQRTILQRASKDEFIREQGPSAIVGGMRFSNRNQGTQHTFSTSTTADLEGKDLNKALIISLQGQKALQLPLSPKLGDVPTAEATKNVLPHMRIARPPGEGRGRNQLLPRYWPRITEQELQQISGDSNSTIVPLFEKVLSASDAGRIGRLVLPKACAEAYFPPISQPEGLPLTIQDSKGKDWHFQFRFWPNNNSRMYVLEGVTPCIQALQLQAGDTVTFSRIDPEGKLVMGFRKATNSVPLHDSQIAAIANGAFGTEVFLSSVSENLPIVSGYSSYRSIKGNGDLQPNSLSEHFDSSEGIISWNKTDKSGGRPSEGFQLALPLVPERRRNRNSVPRNKRLHMDNEDALELTLTWEEAQDLLRPSPSAKPSIVMIEDHEIEEYEEPPVFGKRTIFVTRTSGGHEQWIQCDDCSKWRRLSVDVLVPPKWKCADNVWDPSRSSCAVPGELSLSEIQDLLCLNSDFKRRKISASFQNSSCEPDASGLDALAAVAALRDLGNQTTPIAAPTTRHPRHRPGCTCIVCIQPPSGKGPKHSTTCTCNVCLTVKRRFKTLMLRKKQRQSELEEAEAQKKPPWCGKEDAEASSSTKNFQPSEIQKESESVPLEISKGQIDLNFCPDRDLDPNTSTSTSKISMVNLLKEASKPLDAYLQQNGLKSLTTEQQVTSSSHTVPQATAESEGRTPEESCICPVVPKEETSVDEKYATENALTNAV